MGDLRWSSEVAELQRELKGAAALVGRCIGWIAFRSLVVAGIATVVVCVLLFLAFGVILIGAAFIETRMFIDDPPPGLRAVGTIGLVVLVGGIGALITGYVIWLVVQTLREAVGWVRARRVARSAVTSRRSSPP
jgi:asparagine N-glycosylation enzyme membrane subunit Stt3